MKKKLAGVLGATVPEACRIAFIGQPTTHKQGRWQGRCVVGKDATGDLCVSCVTRLAAAFSAVPAGNCNGTSFNNAGNNANFWSATPNNSNNAWNRNLNNGNQNVNENNNNKNNGFSVRCLRDGCRNGQRRCAQRLSH